MAAKQGEHQLDLIIPLASVGYGYGFGKEFEIFIEVLGRGPFLFVERRSFQKEPPGVVPGNRVKGDEVLPANPLGWYPNQTSLS